jgi:dynein heavy chain
MPFVSQRLTGFDTADITPEIISQLEPYIANEQFESDAVAHVSIACMSICIWVHAIYNFRTTSELTIDPLKAQLEEAERLLEEKRQAHAAHTKTLSKTKVKLKAMKKKQAVLQQQVDTHDTAIAQRQERKKVAGGVESMLHVWKQQWANTSTLAAGSEHSDEHSDRFQSNAPWCNLQVRVNDAARMNSVMGGGICLA